jgi:hypothetical protein
MFYLYVVNKKKNFHLTFITDVSQIMHGLACCALQQYIIVNVSSSNCLV